MVRKLNSNDGVPRGEAVFGRTDIVVPQNLGTASEGIIIVILFSTDFLIAIVGYSENGRALKGAIDMLGGAASKQNELEREVYL